MLELAWLRTGIFATAQYWIAMAIVFAFQIPMDGWLTKLSNPDRDLQSERISRHPCTVGHSDRGLRFRLRDGHVGDPALAAGTDATQRTKGAVEVTILGERRQHGGEVELDQLELSQAFNDAASRYDLMVALNPGYHRHLASAARILADQIDGHVRPVRLLDLGCGSGASTRALVEAFRGDPPAGRHHRRGRLVRHVGTGEAEVLATLGTFRAGLRPRAFRLQG